MIFVPLLFVAVAWATARVQATVIFNEGDLSAHARIDEDLAQWLQVDPAEVARLSSLGGMSGLPIVATEEERQREQEAENLFRTLRGTHMTPAAGMSPSPPNSLSQTGGSCGGFAVAGELVVPPPAAIQATLAPEAGAILPTGPPWRWFRPPKAYQCGFC